MRNKIDRWFSKHSEEKKKEKERWEQRWREAFPATMQNRPIDLQVDWLEYRNVQLEQGFGDVKAEEELSSEELQCLAGQIQKKVHLRCNAEICCNNWVVEILPQLTSAQEFRAKNWFFTKAGYQVIWILNFLGEKDPDWEMTDISGAHFKWHWNEPHEMMEGFFPQENNNIRIYLQYSEEGDDADIMDRIVWVAEAQDENGKRMTNYHSFVTAEDEVADADTLRKLMGCEQCVEKQPIIWNKND